MSDASNVEQMDVLNGFAEIAAALNITVRQAKHRARIGAIPIFRQGRIVCARRSTLAKHFAAQEAAAAAAARDA